MYVLLPQGFLGASNLYTRQYDQIIKDIDHKVRCVDDTLLYDPSIEEAFFPLLLKRGTRSNEK